MVDHLPRTPRYNYSALLNEFDNVQLDNLSVLCYIIGKENSVATCVIPTSDDFVRTRISPANDVDVGMLYHLSSSNRLSGIVERDFLTYTRRAHYFYMTLDCYRHWLLPSLLLGSRVRDFEQEAVSVASLDPLTLILKPQPEYITSLELRTIASGRLFEVDVDNVAYDSERSCRAFCTPIDDLPEGLERGSLLKLVSTSAGAGRPRVPIVTTVLDEAHRGLRPINNFNLLQRIYGVRATHSCAAVPRELVTVTKHDGRSTVMLNAEQSEAVHRYNSRVPGFGVEAPPGSGKTATAAAMAVAYTGGGLQLFLSTANVPVHNVALALADLDYGTRRIVHLVSYAREAAQEPHERSPFSILDLEDGEEEEDSDEEESPAARYHALSEQLSAAGGSRAQGKLIKSAMRAAHAAAVAAAATKHADIILGTVDLILGRLLKRKKHPKQRPCPIQSQLESEVRRVVIDEASQLTEAALNAIIIAFPEAQIVLIGDTKQLPPFKFDAENMVARMAARSALEVFKKKRNLPVINLRQVYRAAPSLIVHYSRAFYDGALVSRKPEAAAPGVRLACVGERVTRNLLFLNVRSGRTEQRGTSKINECEIRALVWLLGRLEKDGHGPDSIMIISFYEAQRRLALKSVQKGYECLTVDSAQGREKDVVIVLTTRTRYGEASAFFTCPRRCNVATSRQKEALIVLGHSSILELEPWTTVLDKQYFQHCTLLK